MDQTHRKFSFQNISVTVAKIIPDVSLTDCKILRLHKNIVIADIFNKYFKSFRFRDFIASYKQTVQSFSKYLSGTADNGLDHQQIFHRRNFHI
ncbi:hypothetical protein SDC9_131132 [bioreactor metagenome]|uniref:Uncharacterized protein n=1 Tax=bioreactor metagenome TaxID=1076179 RepID=A0A645D4C7_9ZZZZ